MGSASLDAVSVVDSSFASLGVTVEILQVVVEVNRPSAEITTKKGGVSSEDCGDVDSSLLAEREGHTCEPLVELCDDSSLFFVVDVLQTINQICACVTGLLALTSPRNHAMRYPKTMASFVSWSSGGEGMPAVDHRSPFHSSSL